MFDLLSNNEPKAIHRETEKNNYCEWPESLISHCSGGIDPCSLNEKGEQEITELRPKSKMLGSMCEDLDVSMDKVKNATYLISTA